MTLIHVVDDDGGSLMSVASALAAAGYKAVPHRGVLAYLEAEIASRPSLVIIDVLGGSRDATAYLSALRARSVMKDIALVIMSDLNVRDGVRVDHLLRERFGVRALLRKPTTRHALLDVVKRALAPVDAAVHQDSSTVAQAISEALSELGADIDGGNLPTPVAKPVAKSEARALAAIPLRQMAAPTAESRTEPRFEATFEVSFANRDDFMREYTHNISRGGLFVRTASPPALDTSVKVVLHLREDPRPLELFVTVAHRNEGGGHAGFGAHLTPNARNELERWHRMVDGLEKRAPRLKGPKVLLLGFSNERAAELARSAGLLCRQEIALVPLASWQSVLHEARRLEEKKKLLIIDVTQPKNDPKRALLFHSESMRELAEIGNASIAFVGLSREDETQLPTDQHLIRAGALATEDLGGALVNWLDLPSRSQLRVPLSGPVTLDDGGESVGEGTLLDVSLGGARFLSRVVYAPGQAVGCAFALPGGEQVQELQAVVRWAKPEGRGMTMCGVSFELDAEHPAHPMLKAYVDQQALLLRSLEGLRRDATSPTGAIERVNRIVPLDDE
jgi:uncharacterized protein (TIGR02266 family)